MPYEYILADLLAEAEDALGVVFVDDEGETVDVASRRLSREELRTVGAYLGIYVRRAVSLAAASRLGRPRLLIVERDSIQVLASALSGGYCLALVQNRPAGVGRAARALRRAAADLEREVLAGIE